jgi:hypothetical protein
LTLFVKGPLGVRRFQFFLPCFFLCCGARNTSVALFRRFKEHQALLIGSIWAELSVRVGA